jgi:integral membrane sensor domain MASE1
LGYAIICNYRGLANVQATPHIRTGATIAIYFIAAAGCIALTRFGAQVAPVWLSTPILVSALLSRPARSWPLLLGLAALAHAAANAINHEHLAFAAPYLLANISEAALAAFLLQHAEVDLTFKERTDVFRFLAVCGVAVPAVSAAIMKIGVTISGQSISDGDVITWFMSIALGLLLFLPLFKAINSRSWRRLTKPNVRAKAALLFALLAIVCIVAMVFSQARFVVFFVFPILVLIAFDLGTPGTAAGLGVTAILLLSGGVLGHSPAFGAADPRETIQRLQLLVLILSACMMPLAAIVEEKARLYESASHAFEEAQQAWGEVIAAEAHYRLLADSTRALLLRVDRVGAIREVSATSSASNYDFGDMEGASLSSYLDEEGNATWQAMLASDGTQRKDEPITARFRMRSGDSSWHTFDATIRRTDLPSASDIIVILTPVD